MEEFSSDKRTISADQRMICNWFATDFQLQLADLQLQFAIDKRTSRTCYYAQTDMTYK